VLEELFAEGKQGEQRLVAAGKNEEGSLARRKLKKLLEA